MNNRALVLFFSFFFFSMFLLTAGSARLLVIVLHFDSFLLFFVAVCSFPPKIKIMISTLTLVQNCTKARGGIDTVMLQISTDSTLGEHMSLMLMG